MSFTCLGDNLYWADDPQEFKDLAQWLEQWSKAGAGPGFRVDDPLVYIQNLNWLSRWIDGYFFTKVSDTLGVLVLVFFTSLLLFKNFKSTQSIKLAFR